MNENILNIIDDLLSDGEIIEDALKVLDRPVFSTHWIKNVNRY